MHNFQVTRAHKHSHFNNALTPVHTVPSGATISFDLMDGAGGQLQPDSTAAAISNFDISRANPAFGPVYVQEAEPGDVLAIEFLTLEPGAHGWTFILPGFGVLADEFAVPQLKVWDLVAHRSDGYAVFKEGIHVPLRPFLGVVGVALAAPGDHSTIPPYVTGGNIDCKHITAGTTLFLPVEVPGALFSCGDGHAAQGDGEVCGTAIETTMKATVRLTVQKGKPWVKSPHFQTTGVDPAFSAMGQSKGEYTTLGIDADLLEAARKAVWGEIDWLVAEKHLTREEAYMLLSVAGDVRVAEMVDMPNHAVACSIPLNIFV